MVLSGDRQMSMENGISRRGFLGLFGTMAAAATAAVVVPERRFWQVGSKLVRPNDAQLLNFGTGHTYNPGVAFDLGNGRDLKFFRDLDIGATKHDARSAVFGENPSAILTEHTSLTTGKKQWVFDDGTRVSSPEAVYRHLMALAGT